MLWPTGTSSSSQGLGRRHPCLSSPPCPQSAHLLGSLCVPRPIRAEASTEEEAPVQGTSGHGDAGRCEDTGFVRSGWSGWAQGWGSALPTLPAPPTWHHAAEGQRPLANEVAPNGVVVPDEEAHQRDFGHVHHEHQGLLPHGVETCRPWSGGLSPPAPAAACRPTRPTPPSQAGRLAEESNSWGPEGRHQVSS